MLKSDQSPREQADTAEAAVTKIHAWNSRKRMFEPQHIRLAWERLREAGWLRIPTIPTHD